MNITELNRRFGAPGRIVFNPGHAGHPNVTLANKYGTAEISLCGANVLSYRPTGMGEVIFRPARRDYNRSESIHGGIPVCWPQFGNRFSKELSQHGFARTMIFEVRGSEYSEDMTEITLGLKSDADTRTLWPHDFDLEYKVSVSMKLNLTLTTRNTGTEAFDFSCGFHPYFLVRERDKVTVEGLDGASYVDGTSSDLREGVWSGKFRADFAPDHIFTMPLGGGGVPSAKHEYAILDSGLRRAIALVSRGNDCTVVWNCGEQHPMSDYEPTDWKKYICVEPVSDWPGGRTLAPGASHVLTAAIQSTLDTSC